MEKKKLTPFEAVRIAARRKNFSVTIKQFNKIIKQLHGKD
jgi:hypothetical protein